MNLSKPLRITALMIALALFSFKLWSQPQWETVAIPMSDGEELAADVYLPSESGTFPVILIQTPYNKDSFHLGLPLGVGWGQENQPYAFVVMDWRCFNGSLGACTSEVDHGQDGYDAVEWIAAQDWCTGKVGTYGPSALGNVQYQTARYQPPHLECCVPEVSSPIQRYDHYYPGGIARAEYIQTLGTLFGSEQALMSFPYDSFLWDIAENETTYPEDITVPFLLIGGWFDINIEDVWHNWNLLTASSPVADLHKIVIGPWVHGGAGPAHVGSLQQGDLEYPEAEHYNEERALDMFDYYLRDIANGYANDNPIEVFDLGTKNWWEGTQQEYDQLVALHIYNVFTTDSTVSNASQLASTPTLTYSYDPSDPSPAVGGHVLSLEQGPLDQVPEVLSRTDQVPFNLKIAYDGPIRGSIKVKLWASTDQLDTDIIVRLCQEQGDGKIVEICSKGQRMRFLEGMTEAAEEFLAPDEKYLVTISLPPIELTPNYDDLWLVVSSSEYPHFNRNMNNGLEMYPDLNPDSLFQPIVAMNSLHSSTSYPSTIELPMDGSIWSVNDIDSPDLFGLFPNPAKNEVTLAASGQVEELRIYGSDGKLVLHRFPSQSTFTISIKDLSAGHYTVQSQIDGIWTARPLLVIQ
jgi:uncharacterized protein